MIGRTMSGIVPYLSSAWHQNAAEGYSFASCVHYLAHSSHAWAFLPLPSTLCQVTDGRRNAATHGAILAVLQVRKEIR